MYSIRGEVDYTSQQRKIGGEFEHIGEVVREVGVSNPYDANAENIALFALYLEVASCLIVVDDGIGMDNAPLSKEQLRGCNGTARSSLASYFHIGHSTKPRGQEIGQFCMGSNLALVQADVIFVLVTRSRDVEPDKYWVVIQTKMHTAFSDRDKVLNATLMTREHALDKVLDTLQGESEAMATAWATWVTKAFAQLSDAHGTLQLFVSKDTDLHRKRFLDVSQETWAAPQKRKACRMISKPLHATQFYTYIRFQTRHGSMLAVPSSESAHNFRKCTLRQQRPFAETYARDMRQAKVRVFCEAHPDGEAVPYGFPYIRDGMGRLQPTVESDEIGSGARLESMTSYWARLGPVEYTRLTATGRSPVAVFVVIDSYNAKMEQYEGLGRSGKTRSGVSICKMQGFVLATHGCYLTTLRGDAADRVLNALLTCTDHSNSHLQIETKKALRTWNEKKGLQNLMIVVDSIFEMKTDRNGVTPTEMHRLQNDQDFLIGLGNALQELRAGRDAHARVFNQMLGFMDRSSKGDAEKDIQDYCQQRAFETMNAGTIRVLPHDNAPDEIKQALDVASETYALPGQGHEHSLVHLFGLYGAAARAVQRHVDRNPWPVLSGARGNDFKRCLPFWARMGLLFNGRGVDAQVFDWASYHDRVYFGDGMSDAVRRMKQFEFKVELESQFNHPFKACDCIVVGSLDTNLVHVKDSKEAEAQVFHPLPNDPLHGIGVYLKDIKLGMQSIMSRVDRSVNLVIPVIVFPDLLRTTFQAFASVEIVAPRVVFTAQKKAVKRRR